MKKKIKSLILIIILIIGLNALRKLLITKHHITYKIDKYTIVESYYKKKKDYYDITISKGKQVFTYTISENLSKQKKIIKNIKVYKKGDVVCIIPLYKKNVGNNLYCSINNEQVSVDYLIKTGNENFLNIKEKTKKYNINIPTNKEIKTEYKSIIVYNDNIPENHIYYLWNYKGVYVSNHTKNSYQSILDYDLYDNVLSCIVEDKFVLLENTSVKGIENIYYYNPSQNKIKRIKLKNSISKDSYINGVIENQIYITDRKQKKEYTLNIKKEQLTEISKDGNYIVYHNNQKELLSKSDFFMEDQIFSEIELTKKEVGNYTYYLENNKVYKYLKGNEKHPILLLELENIKEWQIKEEEILLLKEDTIYSYNDKDGLRNIIESNELNYNYKNIYQIGIKNN